MRGREEGRAGQQSTSRPTALPRMHWWFDDWGGWLVAAIILSALLGGLGWRFGGPLFQLSPFFYFAAALGSVLLLLRTAQALRPERREWRIWILIVLGVSCFVVGNFVWAIGGSLNGQRPLPVVPVLSFTLAHLFLFTALALLPGQQGLSRNAAYWFDMLTGLLGGILFVWFLLPDSNLARFAEYTRWDFVSIGILPVSVIVLLFTFLTILVQLPSRSVRLPFLFLFGGLLSSLFGDLLQREYVGILIDARWSIMLYLMAYGLVAIGAQVRYRALNAERGALPTKGEWPVLRPLAFYIPHAATSVAVAVLIMIGLRQPEREISTILFGVALLVALGIVRQVVTTRENAALLLRTVTLSHALRQRERHFRALVQHASVLIAVVDAGGVPRYVSPAVTRLLGYPPEKLLGQPTTWLIHPDDQPEATRTFAAILARPGLHPPYEITLRHADGSWRYLEAVATNLLDDPDVRGVVIVHRDITEQKALEAQLRYQATHDPLTGLPNRRYFMEQVEVALARAETAGTQVALIFIDLDRFKDVNDAFGHEIGDQFLTEVGARLRESLRTGELAARFGGDEFTVLVEAVDGDEDLAEVADRVLYALNQPIWLNGHLIRSSPSIGVVLGKPGDDPSKLLRWADVAMYQAKEQGRAQWALFNPTESSRGIREADRHPRSASRRASSRSKRGR